MGTLTAQYLIGRVIKTLNDDPTTPVRWTNTELLEALNDGQREIVKLIPQANPVTGVVLLAEGTRQAIPSTGVSLIDVVRNMGLSGSTPGRVIKHVLRQVIDDENPSWHTDTADSAAKLWMFDSRTPKIFYVYPKQPSAPGYAEIVYSAVPAAVAAAANPISIDDVYANDLINWILFQAYSKDAEHAANTTRAAGYYTAFTQGLGLKQNADVSISPAVHGKRSTGG